MAWLDTWGSPLLASIAGVIAAAAFTWFFSFRAERKRREGIRALVASEVWHNEAMVNTLVGSLKHIDPHRSGMYAGLVHALPKTVRWQHSRWDLPDVGSAFSPDELASLSEWYFRLDSLSIVYELLISDAARAAEVTRRYAADSPKGQLARQVSDDAMMVAISGVLELAEAMLEEKPPIDKLDTRDGGAQQYDESQARHAAATTPAPAESAVHSE